MTVADPEEFGFAVETALTVTGVVVTLPFPLEVVGTPLGATKRPDVEIKPVAWLPPVTPLTSHVTAVLDCPFTVALNCWVVKMATLIGFGVTVTETGGGGGALAPPQEPRNTEARSPKIKKTRERMGTPLKGLSVHASTGIFKRYEFPCARIEKATCTAASRASGRFAVE